jgi:hypothetical protein
LNLPKIHCHGIDIETAADVIRPRADEALNRGGEQTAGFELFFQRLALGFGSFEQGVCLVDRVFGKSKWVALDAFFCG